MQIVALSICVSLVGIILYFTQDAIESYGDQYLYPEKQIVVYPHGVRTGGISIVLTPDQVHSSKALATYLSALVDVPNPNAPVVDRVYRGNGKLVEAYKHIQMNDHLYLVPHLPSKESTINEKQVVVYPNGASTGGIHIVLSPDQVTSTKALATYLSTLVQIPQHNQYGPVIANRVYRGNGQLVESYKDIEMDDRLYLVPPDLLFIWPFVKIGHKVYIDSIESPTEKPIILESFTESPRTFHVHHFFTETEADALIERILEIDDKHQKLQQSSIILPNGAVGIG